MVRLVRKHSYGMLKIKDRKPKKDEQGKEVKGEYVEVIHRLSPEAYKKPFEVNDEDYVLKHHGAILEKA